MNSALFLHPSNAKEYNNMYQTFRFLFYFIYMISLHLAQDKLHRCWVYSVSVWIIKYTTHFNKKLKNKAKNDNYVFK